MNRNQRPLRPVGRQRFQVCDALGSEPLLYLIQNEVGNVDDDIDAEDVEEVYVVRAVDDRDRRRHSETLLGNLARDEIRAVIFAGRDEHLRTVRAPPSRGLTCRRCFRGPRRCRTPRRRRCTYFDLSQLWLSHARPRRATGRRRALVCPLRLPPRASDQYPVTPLRRGLQLPQAAKLLRLPSVPYLRTYSAGQDHPRDIRRSLPRSRALPPGRPGCSRCHSA